MDFTQYNFKNGKSYQGCNVYFFEDNNTNKLTVSEKIDNFENGSVSNYLLFEYDNGKTQTKSYIDRKSEEYKNLANIRNIVDNIGNIVVQCTGCNTIVLKDKITSGKGDRCIYCDKYACRNCKKLKPLIELDENRLCERCKNELRTN